MSKYSELESKIEAKVKKRDVTIKELRHLFNIGCINFGVTKFDAECIIRLLNS